MIFRAKHNCELERLIGKSFSLESAAATTDFAVDIQPSDVRAATKHRSEIACRINECPFLEAALIYPLTGSIEKKCHKIFHRNYSKL